MAVFVDDLKKAVIDNAKASDKIVIISGYLSPDMVDEVATLGIPFEFYYGMYGVEKMNDALQRNVEAVLTGMDGVPLDEIDARLEELQKELLKVANAKGNYDSIVDEIYSLREAKQNAQVESAEREGMKKRISEMQQFLAEQQQDITEYDEQLVRRLIEKITVYDERVTVEFKSGTSVDVRR